MACNGAHCLRNVKMRADYRVDERSDAALVVRNVNFGLGEKGERGVGIHWCADRMTVLKAKALENCFDVTLMRECDKAAAPVTRDVHS